MTKRLTIEISPELQLKLQEVLPHNTRPTRKELFTKLIEMVLEGVEEFGQGFIFDILSEDITFSQFLTQEQKNTIGVNEFVRDQLPREHSEGFSFTWKDVYAARKSMLERGEIEEVETPFGTVSILTHKLLKEV